VPAGASTHLQLPDVHWSLRRFLKKLSSPHPVPGGGSAAALASALGCALGAMVCEILLRRKRISPSDRREIRKSLKQLGALSSSLWILIRQDARAYERLVRAVRSGRAAGQARRRAIQCPMEICEASAAAARILSRVSRSAGPLLVSDLKAGRALLGGAFDAAAEMVRINFKGETGSLDGIRDAKRLGKLRKKIRGE